MADEVMQNDNSPILPEDLLYRREVYAWLHDFIDEGGKYPGSPKTHSDVLTDVFELWRDKEIENGRGRGFLDAGELKKELALKYMADAPGPLRSAIETIHTYGRKKDIDEFSGGLRKTHVADTTGFAHLYARMIEQSVGILELDFSNMGGTNNFFRNLLAEAREVAPEIVADEDAEAFTDRCAKVLTTLMMDVILEVTGRDDAICIRAGGDELRVIMPGVKPEMYQYLIAKIHQKSEEFTAHLGLHDHPHHKKLEDIFKRGFGYALDIKDLKEFVVNKPGDPGSGWRLNNMESNLKENKVHMGHARQGQVCEKLIREFILGQAQDRNGEQTRLGRFIEQKVKQGYTKEKILNEAIARETKRCQKSVDESYAKYQASKPPQDEAKNTLEVIDRRLETEEYALGFNEVSKNSLKNGLPNALQVHMEDGGIKKTNFETPEQRAKNTIQAFIEEEGLELQPYEKQLLKHVLSVLSPQDPVTGTKLHRDMPEVAQIYIQDSYDLGQRILNDPEALEALQETTPSNINLDQYLQHLKPQGMRLQFHNQAGFNNLMGQYGANTVLRHEAQDIIIGTMNERGLVEDRDFVMGHYGAGEFQIVMKPIVQDELTGKDKVVTGWDMDSISDRIVEKTGQLGMQNVTKFAQDGGAELSDDVPKDMLIQQVPDAKAERAIDGVFAHIISGELEVIESNTKTPGGAALYRQKKNLAWTIDSFRKLRSKESPQQKGDSPWAKQEMS